jgi:hypothetical protein
VGVLAINNDAMKNGAQYGRDVSKQFVRLQTKNTFTLFV